MMLFMPFEQKKLSLPIWESLRRRVHTLLPKEDSVDVEKAEEELGHKQFLKSLMRVTQFKVISHTPQ